MSDLDIRVERNGSKIRAVLGDELDRKICSFLDVRKDRDNSGIFALTSMLLKAPRVLSSCNDIAITEMYEHFVYYDRVMSERSVSPVDIWSGSGAGVLSENIAWVGDYLPEFVGNMRNCIQRTNGKLSSDHEIADVTDRQVSGWIALPRKVTPPGRTRLDIYRDLQAEVERNSAEALRKVVPFTVLGLSSEANLSVLIPKFEETMRVPGDICEFGCFRGTISIKLAFLVKAAGLAKTVYAFDTFEGFQIADPGGGALGVGAFGDNFDAFGELTKWSRVLPVVPIKGDATVTCARITSPLSFVWLDLDMGVLMDPVLWTIWPHIGPDTIIGIDDVGRPETPTVEPWVDEIMRTGKLVEIDRDEQAFIRFYRRA